MFIAPIVFSLLGFIIAFFFGRRLGRFFTSVFTSFLLFISWIASIVLFYKIALLKINYYVTFYTLLNVEFLNVEIGFQLDTVTSVMLVVVTTVSFLTHLYSVEYMNEDPHQTRFMSYLSLFTFFMLILVTADNLLQLFVGWEGVGICSYLLISFWFTRIQANKSSIMAILTNKIGDLALMSAISIIIIIFKTINFSELFICIQIFYGPNIIYWIGILFIIAAVGKSAQVGLHIWLPEAMEGPTPVSSLIHAATMVTAGIFLIVRCSFIFEQIPEILSWISLIGSITAFMGASIGIFQNDLKKIIAYSTCSQLGYMFMACGYSNYNGSLFHLFNHAFFKALLFLTAGYIIHASANEQDMRRLGGLNKLLPFSYLMILIGSLSIMGFPFFSGFYSKEKILEIFYNKYYFHLTPLENFYFLNYFAHLLSMIAMIFTIVYSIKLIILTYFGTTNTWKTTLYAILRKNNYIYATHYASLFIITPLLALAYLSIWSGYLCNDMFIGPGTDFWNSSIAQTNISLTHLDHLIYYINYNNNNYYLFQFEFNTYIRRIPFVWTIYYISLIGMLYLYYKKFILNMIIGNTWIAQIHIILTEKYLFYNKLIIEPITYNLFKFAKTISYEFFDKGLIELIGPYGIVQTVRHISLNYHKYHTMYLNHYMHIMLIALLVAIQLVLIYT
jgi:NADH-ubiquinone oxidoreductase chain 5